MAHYSIRKMKGEEIEIAIDWAQKEGWNPGLNDGHCFYQADPKGFFIGLLDDEPISVGSAVAYDDNYAFCGLYIVKKEYRDQGYGIRLTEECLKYVEHRIIGLDGVLANIPKYERLGFIASHKQIRYEGIFHSPFSSSPYIVDMKNIPFNQLEKFDQKYFPAPRSAFLRCWTHQPNAHALGYLENQELGGYGVIRKCHQGYKIGPLFANSSSIAEKLFESLCAQVGGGTIYLDIPEPNEKAQSLVKLHKMTSKFEVIRMYRNGVPQVNLEDGIYGITTFELG